MLFSYFYSMIFLHGFCHFGTFLDQCDTHTLLGILPIRSTNVYLWSKNTARKRSNTGRLRTVFYRNPGRCFTTVCNEDTACIRPYTAQLRCCIRCRITVTRITAVYGEVTTKNTVIRNHRPGTVPLIWRRTAIFLTTIYIWLISKQKKQQIRITYEQFFQQN
jgi:hypothetical protein